MCLFLGLRETLVIELIVTAIEVVIIEIIRIKIFVIIEIDVFICILCGCLILHRQLFVWGGLPTASVFAEVGMGLSYHPRIQWRWTLGWAEATPSPFAMARHGKDSDAHINVRECLRGETN